MIAVLRVAVCMKQVLDPEAPASTLVIDEEALTVSAPGTPPLWNPNDLNALKAANDLGDAEITIVTAGPSLSKNLILKALAHGAAKAVVVEASMTYDSAVTAQTLVEALAKAGEFDLILTGRRAPDTNAGAVGFLLARELGRPVVALATAIRVDEGGESIEVDRLVDGGIETITCPLPAVVTVSNEVGELPYTEFKAIAAAKKKPLETLAVTPESPVPVVKLAAMEKPDFERECKMIDADALVELLA